MSPTELTLDQIMAYASGELSETDARAVAAAIQRNASHRRQLARIESVLKTMRAHLQTEPSARALHMAFRAAAGRAPNESWVNRLSAAIANCIFDSRLQPALGLRSSTGPVQLSYESALADVDLELTRESAGWSLMGHVATRAGSPVDEILVGQVGASTPEKTVTPNAQGVFRMQLEAANYEIVIRGAAETLRLPALNLA